MFETTTSNDKYQNNGIPFSQEVYRKFIHLLSLSIPIGYSLLDKKTALTVLIPLAIISIIIDLLSRKKTIVQKYLRKFFGKMLRPHEYEDRLILNGASWVLISACFTIFFFPKILAVTGFAILIISDSSAALFGRKFGTHHFWGKTLEGSMAFFVTALITVFIIGIITSAPWIFFAFSAVAALISAAVEAASAFVKIDDNISIPISYCVIMLLGNMIAASMGMSYIGLM
jgi:dolichol kinase